MIAFLLGVLAGIVLTFVAIIFAMKVVDKQYERMERMQQKEIELEVKFQENLSQAFQDSEDFYIDN